MPTMTWLILLNLVVVLALAAVSIYEHVSSFRLSLPLTPALIFVIILLPLLAGAQVHSLHYLANKTSQSSSAVIRYLNPVVLQVLQGVIITVLATIYGSHVLPSASRECELSTRWQQLFGAKDERAIRAIQEAFQCCGFRTVKDMAWPFPPTAVQCSSKFDRSLACQVPWTNALQRSAAVNFGAMVAVAVMQIIIIILARRYGGKTSSSSWTRLWWPQQDGSERTTSRPLLTRQEAQVEEVDEEVGPGGPDDPRYGTLETNSGPDPTNLPSEMQSPQNERRELPEVS